MQIRLISQNSTIEADVKEGIDLLTVLRAHGLSVPAPCGGRGSCGKCLVEIDGLGLALACQTIIGRDRAAHQALSDDHAPVLVVRLPPEAEALILIEGLMPKRTLNPLVQHRSVQVPPPSLEHQTADDRRFSEACGYQVPLPMLGQLSAALSAGNGYLEFIGREDTMTVVRFLPTGAGLSGIGKRVLPGVAVDIGTTTLAACLYDLADGRQLACAAMVNPQVVFGADVISRIAIASRSDLDQADMQRVICQAVTKLCVQMLNRVGDTDLQPIQPEDIAQITFAGNTTMMHLLLGLPSYQISVAPFNPVTTRAWTGSADSIGLSAFPHAVCTVLPAVASYVGADITAGILALGLDQPKQDSALLIDIGTNGEIVLRAGDRLTACATAAGPAFEGADISSGMSGIAGAIDHVWIQDDDLCYSVLSKGSASINKCDASAENDTEAPAGICGSGLIDAVAMMLETGAMDETGRIGSDEAALTQPIRRRLTKVDSQPAFVLAFAHETRNGKAVILTQKDIRELQNAKAAIASGIQLLLEKEGVSPASVKTIYLAGGFGQYLNVRSARKIGLLPATLTGRVVPAGNTSAMGAISVLLDWTLLEQCQTTAESVIYRELSSDPLFSDLFIEALMFPEETT